MGKINVLNSEVAALIAAGEVVERPSSVIKELVENSIDAGAKHITCEIKNGGVSYMRVTDDGCGIAPEDVENAFLRHSTSKISVKDDLESILTLGFRGEALHSIAAVSTIEMMTKRPEDTEGTYIKITSGNVEELEGTGCPSGTTITVKELFFNTPARMKFLKKDSVEAGYIEDILRKIALGNPDISFKFINNQKEIFFTSGDGILKNTVYSIYGKETASAMLETEYEEDGVKVWGLVGNPSLSRPNRSMQTYYVNGRCVTNKSLYMSLLESYKNKIMTGRFPVCVLNVKINPAQCDVNVHPSKAEIKFSNDKIVYDAVYWAAKNALYAQDEHREFVIEKLIPPTVEDEEVFEEKPAPEKSFIPFKKTEKPFIPFEESKVFLAEEPKVKTDYLQKNTEVFESVEETTQEEITEIERIPRIIGQLFDTYLLCEDEALLLIDQHAAHERIIYEKLKKEKDEKTASPQMLMIPEIKKLTPSEFAVFQSNTEFFESVGFEAEEFGINTIKISALPATLADDNAGNAIVEIIDALSNSNKAKETAKQEYALYRVACRAAIKAGHTMKYEEQQQLVREALRLEKSATCPHGRPIILRLTKTEIEKQFKRIV